MITVDLRADMREVEKTLRGLRDGTPTVMSRAINRTLTPIRATAAREIAKDMKIKVGTARRAMRLQRATPARLSGAVTASGRRLPLIDFGARQTSQGVSYNLGRGRTTAKSLFIATMPSGNRGVFGRLGKPRLPIVERFGPSIPAAFVNARIEAAMRAVANTRWPRELDAQLRFLISGTPVGRGDG